jgi:hypothetical protein
VSYFTFRIIIILMETIKDFYKSVAALARELDELHRVEEALVAAAIAAGEPVHRSPSASPPAVLGVRVADRVSRAA